MRLVVLDTNVIVSAAIKPRTPPARLLGDWILDGQVQVVTCPCIISEYREVVRRKKFACYGFPPPWLDFLIEESLQLTDLVSWPTQGPDAKDAPFLALAKITGAWLVTGNLKHFPKNIRDGVRVLSPSDYLRHLEQSPLLPTG